MERFIKIESKEQVHILSFFRKGDQEEIQLIACDDLKELQEFMHYLNVIIGHTPGLGIWSQDTPGYYRVTSIPQLKASELYERQKEVINRARNSEY